MALAKKNLLLFLVLVCGGIGLLAMAIQAENVPEFSTAELVIKSDQGLKTFQVQVAKTPEQRAYGLMNRKTLLPINQGMLFVFEKPQLTGMWMKDTYIPLDMLFITEDGRISSISAHTKPLDETPILAQEPVLYVLELGAGISAQNNIRSGNYMRLPIQNSAN